MEDNKKQGIQSIEIGVSILQLVAAAERPISITEIAELCQTSKSKIYRYLNSFVRTGMLAKNPDSKYVLGKEILRLGLKASNDIKIVDIAQPFLLQLKDKFNETCGLAVYGKNGPFFVSWEESAGPIGIKVGSKVGVTDSATGKVFASYLPEAVTEPLIERELENVPNAINDFKKILPSIRKNGYSYTVGTIVQGISAVASPVFDRNNTIVAVLSVVGFYNSIDTTPDSEIVINLKQCSEQISTELGWKE
ncbi:DNA-binding IclR family transcriptional regulator [Neobacillus niacini]|uniref:IclR family transcriptional regulator n=1 Tax=Neobacillus niacini TaxID=86668 RepID=UPI00285A69D7|nr:IclR family transcriptional regulator [Neobacillus niacini]MDR7079412.1 DNA-binding IclR family transcriptional regulator [Neobacillus niacini]